MQFDVFISYAWGGPENTAHREWVRLLAAHLKQIGFHVGIDSEVDYGEDLTGFMREIEDAKRVLMIVDEGYVERADNYPDSVVVRETKTIQDVVDDRPNNWLSVLFVRNEKRLLPKWMEGRDPKYFDFSYRDRDGSFPGSEQIDDLWRWLAGLPADKGRGISPATIRERMYRVERIDNLMEPGNWSCPELESKGVAMAYGDAPSETITLGYGDYEFKVRFGKRGGDSVYILNDYIKAVGMIPDAAPNEDLDANVVASYTRSCRCATPSVGQRVALLNNHGCACVLKVTGVTNESHDDEFVPSQVVFDYTIFAED